MIGKWRKKIEKQRKFATSLRVEAVQDLECLLDGEVFERKASQPGDALSLSDVTAQGHDRDQIVEPCLIIARRKKRRPGASPASPGTAAGKVVDVDRILGLLSPVARRASGCFVEHFECVAALFDELIPLGIVTVEASGIHRQIWVREERKRPAVIEGSVSHDD